MPGRRCECGLGLDAGHVPARSRHPGRPSNCHRCRPLVESLPLRSHLRSLRRKSRMSNCRSMPFAVRRLGARSRWLSTCESMSSDSRTRQRVEQPVCFGVGWLEGGLPRRCRQRKRVAALGVQARARSETTICSAAAKCGSCTENAMIGEAFVMTMNGACGDAGRGNAGGRPFQPPHHERPTHPFRCHARFERCPRRLAWLPVRCSAGS